MLERLLVALNAEDPSLSAVQPTQRWALHQTQASRRTQHMALAHAPDHPGDDPTGHDRCNAINTTLIRNELERNPAKHLRRAWNPLCIGFSTLVVPSNAPIQQTTRIPTTNAKACRVSPINSPK